MAEIVKVGVVGTGLMGTGIAHLCTQSGYQTVMRGRSEESVAKGLQAVRASLERFVSKGRMSEGEKEAALGLLRATRALADLGDCDLIIEAIIEDLAEKKKLFRTLDALAPPHSILATDTAALPVAEIAAATRRPERVVGIHILSPAPASRMVEVVRTPLTSEETLAAAVKFCESLGKTVVVVADTPGFIINRLLAVYLLEAIRLLESGAATREAIDKSMVLGCGYPLGPLSLLDYVGLDQFHDLANAIYRGLKDPKYQPPALLKRMVAEGRLGRKSGKGFYEYGS